MTVEHVKNNKIYGLFINQEIVQEGTYNDLMKFMIEFEVNVKLQFGQENVEVLVNELDDETPNKLIRIEKETEVIFYDLRLLDKNI